MHEFNLEKPYDVGDGEKNQLKTSNWFAAWKTLDGKGR
jgi:hypothetical protein